MATWVPPEETLLDTEKPLFHALQNVLDVHREIIIESILTKSPDRFDTASLRTDLLNALRPSMRTLVLSEQIGQQQEMQETLALSGLDGALNTSAVDQMDQLASEVSQSKALQLTNELMEKILAGVRQTREMYERGAINDGFVRMSIARTMSRAATMTVAIDTVTEMHQDVSFGLSTIITRILKELETVFRIEEIWVAENDGRTCRICRELDGKSRDEWEKVAPSGKAHPRCRCRIRRALKAG
jgi:hypothetical protein